MAAPPMPTASDPAWAGTPIDPNDPAAQAAIQAALAAGQGAPIALPAMGTAGTVRGDAGTYDWRNPAQPGQTPTPEDWYTKNIGGPIADTVGPTANSVGEAIKKLGIPVPGLGGGAQNLPPDVIASIQQSIARQGSIADQMGQAYQNFTPTGAPTIAQPGQIQAANASQLSPIQAALAQSQNANAAQIGQTFTAKGQAPISAQQIQGQQLPPAAQALSPMFQGTRVGAPTMANTAQIDQSQQAQMRAAQMGLIGGLQGAIEGKEPSVAEIMLRNATDRNVANQYALAQAASGMNTGLAQRGAMINAAEMNQNAVMQQAILRAQEIAQARGQLGSTLEAGRGADIGLATNQAGLTQQANLANAAATNTAGLTQAQIDAARLMAQGQAQASASQFNAGQTNTVAQNQAQLSQAAQLANQQASLQAGTTNATLGQQLAIANSAAQNTTAQQNAAMQQAAGLQNAQLGTQTNLANANNQTAANTASSQLANAVNLANAGSQTQVNVATGQLQAQAGIANAQNQVTTNAQNQQAQQNLAQNQIAAAGQAGQTSVGYGGVYAQLADAQAKKDAATLGAIATAGAAALKSGG